MASMNDTPQLKPQNLSAGVIVVRREQGQWRYLLLRAYRNWDFPKGLVEAGEEPLEAAIREVEEETCVNDLRFHWGHDFRETPPYGRGKIARYYAAETERVSITLPVSAELGRPEHDEYRWVDYATAREMVAPRVLPALEWIHELIGETVALTKG